MTGTALTTFLADLSRHGIVYNGPVLADDKLHRFKADGDHDSNSWYALRVRDGVVFGGFGCWKRGVKEGWCSKKQLTSDERKLQNEALRDFAERDRQEREEKQAKARATLTAGFKSWKKATEHPYLTNKKLTPVGDVRICDLESYRGWLVVPMFDEKGVLQSAQYIAPDGSKRFQYGGQVQGCMFPVREEQHGPILVCEGYATGLSLAQSTGWTTVCAFNCGNLLAVSRIIRKAYPDRLLIIAGDNDAATQDNPGLTKATEAAAAVKGLCVVPTFADSAEGRLTDFNDLACVSGNSEVKRQILGAIPEALKPPAIVLAERQFDASATPPDEVPVFRLQNTVVATRGNIVTITAQVKTGKSATLGAMQSATMAGVDSDVDCLGFHSQNPDGRMVLHFDSEQSKTDHWKATMRTLHRAGLKTPPSWFKSYLLTGLGCKRAWECVLEAVKQGPIHSVFLDGVADFVSDVNDAAECNAMVAQLQGLAGKLDCPIICVIHFNPGSEKSRGHLGSELERKAESNLRLDKDDETTVIWSNKQRGAPILKSNGPSFKWSDEKQMHVSCSSVSDIKTETERADLLELLMNVYGDRSGMNYGDLTDGLEKLCKQSRATVARKVKRAMSFGLLSRVANVYGLNR